MDKLKTADSAGAGYIEPSEELASAKISLEPAYVMWALKEEQFDEIIRLLKSIDGRLKRVAGV